jgi:hypothetical protein
MNIKPLYASGLYNLNNHEMCNPCPWEKVLPMCLNIQENAFFADAVATNSLSISRLERFTLQSVGLKNTEISPQKHAFFITQNHSINSPLNF